MINCQKLLSFFIRQLKNEVGNQILVIAHYSLSAINTYCSFNLVVGRKILLDIMSD
jgi:hypothetical protein